MSLGGSTPRSFTRREPSLGSGSRTSSVPESGLVSVPEPAVSRSGFASGRLPGRWGDFPHGRAGVASAPAGTRLPLPSERSARPVLSSSVRAGRTSVETRRYRDLTAR